MKRADSKLHSLQKNRLDTPSAFILTSVFSLFWSMPIRSTASSVTVFRKWIDVFLTTFRFDIIV
ncbi:hypothetical protein [Phocaeicola dorei]|uniref:Uncharacterized protein n=1 Tax=Phocaeicola dorei TaxID=357276 RepID=A0A4R4I4P8_9BACT|nr:hypothetical protein [Phocaeicola dorei]MBE5081095.1 hypothetical protein [Phocaeicola dorei]TDA76385.1 hypothetical protein E1I98_08460 [Phocaeicola dorei]TDB24382.1 hypothetical protein E1J03_03740 [Phocaeicola dorei]